MNGGGSGTSPVPDIRDVQSFVPPYYQVTVDWLLLDSGMLDVTQALATAIVVALGTNALANSLDQLPDPDSTDLGGWWGNLDCDTIWNAWPIGSQLWLLRRSAILSAESRQGATITRVKMAISAAIQPFANAKIISTYKVNAWRVGRQQINARVVIYKGPTPVIDLLYTILWDELKSAFAASLTAPIF